MAQIAVEEAIRLGATFADVRYEVHQHEDLVVRNGRVHRALVTSDRGLGLRVLVNGAWGFAAVGQPTRHDVTVLARRATELARAAAVIREAPVRLAHEPAHCAVYRTPIERDPLAVAIEDKMELLFAIDEKLRSVEKIKLSLARFSAHRARKLYVSSEGSEIDQDLVHTRVGFQAGASDGADFQLRSYPGPDGTLGACAASGQALGQGWELVESLPLLDHAEQIAEDAVAQLGADECPERTTDLILGAPQVALQIHETAGHAFELDRAVFLSPDRLGRVELGSKLVNLYADASAPGGLGTFGFDDEGVEGQRVELVTEGRFAGYLSSREAARHVGLERSSGAMRASSWSRPPLIRMTNICLGPGPDGGDLEALIADTKSGVLMDVTRSVSVDEQRYGFQFGCETAWEIKDGKKTRRLKNPTYAGVTPTFWKACDAICDESSWAMYGIVHCGKGQPVQHLSVGHGAAPARFRNVRVGTYRPDLRLYADGDAFPILSHPDAEKVTPRPSTSVPGEVSAGEAPKAESESNGKSGDGELVVRRKKRSSTSRKQRERGRSKKKSKRRGHRVRELD